MNDFDTRVANIGRQRAIAFFVPRLAALAVLGAILAVLLAGCSKDDTDPAIGRSGMDPLTDNATGCQYLYRRHAMLPRIAADGKTHMGCKAVAP